MLSIVIFADSLWWLLGSRSEALKQAPNAVDHDTKAPSEDLRAYVRSHCKETPVTRLLKPGNNVDIVRNADAQQEMQGISLLSAARQMRKPARSATDLASSCRNNGLTTDRSHETAQKRIATTLVDLPAQVIVHLSPGRRSMSRCRTARRRRRKRCKLQSRSSAQEVG